MKSTLSEKAARDYKFFEACVEASVRAGLLAMRDEQVEHALVARVSCAGIHKDGIDKSFVKLVQDAVDDIGHGFRSVVVVGKC